MITLSCECKCKFGDRKCNLNQKRNKNKCQCKWKNLKQHHICEKDCLWNPATWSCENGKYVESIIDNSATTCNQIIGTIETIPACFNEKRWPVKQKSSIFYSPFY